MQDTTEDEDFSVLVQPSPKCDADEKIFAHIIVWALGRKSISCNAICEEFSIGWRRAVKFVGKLYELGVIGEAYSKNPRVVLPTCIEELSPEIMDFLARYGYVAENLQMLFDAKHD